jgi:hypothetical protein
MQPKIGLKQPCYFRYLFISYMILAYLSLPTINFLLKREFFDYSYFIAVISILFMALGIFIGNKLVLNNLNINKKFIHLNSKFFIAISIFFLLSSFAAKFLKQIPLIINEGSIDFSNFLKPNFLTEIFFLCIMTLIMLKASIASQKIKKYNLVFYFISLGIIFFIWTSLTGVGRSMTAYLIIGLVINYLMIYKFQLRIIIPIIIFFLLLWFVISAYKSVVIEGESASIIFKNYFFMDKFINRFTHSNIFSQVVDLWPKDLFFYFYGWQDFFTMPSIAVGRNFLDGNDFGHALGFIGNEDLKTGVGPTFLGDLYMRGQEIGCIIGFLILGILLCLYDFLLFKQPVENTFILNGILSVFIIHGSEDFIFLTFSTSLVIFLFLTASIYFVRILTNTKFVDCKKELLQ